MLEVLYFAIQAGKILLVLTLALELYYANKYDKA